MTALCREEVVSRASARKTSARVKLPRAPILRKLRRLMPSQNLPGLPKSVNMMGPFVPREGAVGSYRKQVYRKLQAVLCQEGRMFAERNSFRRSGVLPPSRG